MDRPPRNLKESLFNRKSFFFSLLQGLSVLAVVFAIFITALRLKKGEPEARTLAFATLVFANIMLIITNLSWSKSMTDILKKRNKALGIVVIAALAALGLVLYIAPLRSLFHFSVLSFYDLLAAIICGAASIAWFEILKKTGILSREKAV
jgi:Ca2+-transporting ATPase